MFFLLNCVLLVCLKQDSYSYTETSRLDQLEPSIISCFYINRFDVRCLHVICTLFNALLASGIHLTIIAILKVKYIAFIYRNEIKYSFMQSTRETAAAPSLSRLTENSFDTATHILSHACNLQTYGKHFELTRSVHLRRLE